MKRPVSDNLCYRAQGRVKCAACVVCGEEGAAGETSACDCIAGVRRKAKKGDLLSAAKANLLLVAIKV